MQIGFIGLGCMGLTWRRLLQFRTGMRDYNHRLEKVKQLTTEGAIVALRA